MEDHLHDIVKKIDSLVSQLNKKPSAEIVWGIINATWGNKVDIMIFSTNYPELIRIADLATDIEIESDDTDYRRELWRELAFNLDIMKKKLEIS